MHLFLAKIGSMYKTSVFFFFLLINFSNSATAQNLDSLFKAHDAEFSFAEKIFTGEVSARHLYLRADRYIRITYSSDTKTRIERDETKNRITVWSSFEFQSSVNEINHKSASGKIAYRLTIQALHGSYEYKYDNFVHSPTKENASAFGLLIKEDKCPYSQVKGAEEWKDRVWDEIKTAAFEWTTPQSGELKTVMFTVNPNESLDK